jgi:AcrR family transcriptional regulator
MTAMTERASARRTTSSATPARRATARRARPGTGTGTPPDGDAPRAGRRTDAEQNRARILAAARAVLAQSSDATLNSIARRAGVGQGTLYRHFRSREDLLLALYHADVRAVIDAAPALLAAHPPAEALRRWLDRLAAYGRIKHGVAQAVEAATRADLAGEYYGQVTAAITLLLDAGQAAGVIRRDVDADELLLLVGFLWRIDNRDWAARSRHLLALVLDGLRPPGDQES